MQFNAEAIDRAVAELQRLRLALTPDNVDETRVQVDEVIAEAVASPLATIPPPPPPTEVPPPPSTEVPAPPAADDAELDSAGTPWNEALHAGNKTKKQDGTWKQRRGTGKAATPAPPKVTVKEVQAVLGKLFAGGVTAEEIDEPISQAVASDLSVKTGGMKALRQLEDPAGAAFRAMNACRALAVLHKVEL